MDARRILMFLVAATVALVGSYGFAQQDSSPKTEAKPKAPSNQSPTLDDEIEQQSQNLSPEEKLEDAQKKIAQMKLVLGQTQDLLEKVRKEEKDILKLNCINEKLSAVKGFVKVSEQSYVNLKQSVERDDTEAQRHHYTLIAIAGQKVDNLGEEAKVCAGEVLRYAEDTKVDRHVNPDIADVEVIEIDNDAFNDRFATDRLPELTPFE